MQRRRTCLAAAAISFPIWIALPAGSTEKHVPERSVGTTAARPAVPLDSQALAAMLRADRDKDGTLTREELEHYDVGLARRFKDVDSDRDGKLTLYEFEKLLAPNTGSMSRR